MIWKGPITGNDGKEVLAGGANADDKFLGGINFFVKGVEGKVPGGDEEVTARERASSERAKGRRRHGARPRRIPRQRLPSCCARCPRPSCTCTSRARSSPS